MNWIRSFYGGGCAHEFSSKLATDGELTGTVPFRMEHIERELISRPTRS
jgi:hypothetical protein